MICTLLNKVGCTFLSLLLILSTPLTYADNQWGRYKWGEKNPPVILDIVSNVSADWNTHLSDAKADWNVSDVLTLKSVTGSTNVEDCFPQNGNIQVCSYNYKNTGWLGIAQIWIHKGKEITKAITKLNDYYYDPGSNYYLDLDAFNYNTPDWRQLVTCQEIGHTFGLAHQDENYDNTNLGSCMDYTSNPSTNTHPNSHDYAMLEIMYPLGGSDDGGNGGNNGGSKGNCPGKSCGNNVKNEPPAMNEVQFKNRAQWGRSIHRSSNGHHEVYELDFGSGFKVITFVTWAK